MKSYRSRAYTTPEEVGCGNTGEQGFFFRAERMLLRSSAPRVPSASEVETALKRDVHVCIVDREKEVLLVSACRETTPSFPHEPRTTARHLNSPPDVDELRVGASIAGDPRLGTGHFPS